ncbi:photosystem II manganese-stabilizing polypeptide [Micractinium conductrix]|uniref:Photosystem II manganese-stabilizing polypeptide n=1 Tax=Micractinium conductrix TaxID=554055 RepID=A0A2P6V645_9CHLO|nr:photosystem II manganese-stabilizing polypeptide [Micractinium conductrix]|eukprot:PSC69559.1 photosystem II manganese-stabilizing polypeptide [Micractinium conductrix]
MQACRSGGALFWPQRRRAARRSDAPTWQEHWGHGAGAAVAFFASLAIAGAASASTFEELQSLSYKEVKGSGLANMCPSLNYSADETLDNMKPGAYQMEGFCMEPTSFKVRPVGMNDFEKSTLLTRMTYTLDQMNGTFKVERDGTVELQEKDGIDYAPVTVNISGGEEVPFMFAVKNLKAAGPWSGFTGEFDVNAYRGATFLGRGGATGWDYQKGLQAAGNQDELDRENFKKADPTRGQPSPSARSTPCLARWLAFSGPGRRRPTTWAQRSPQRWRWRACGTSA